MDSTGCGIPVIDMLREARPNAILTPILLTGGHAESIHAQGVRHVSKVIWINAALVCLLQQRRVKFASALPEAEIIRKELSNYTMRIPAVRGMRFIPQKTAASS